MKILKYILNIVIWTIIGVILMTVLVFRIPAVQQYAGDAVSGALSSKLGTKVTVGAVNPGWFNRLIIDNVCILDQQGERLLTAHRLGVRISLIPLIADQKIDISTAQILGAHVNLYRTAPDAPANYQFVLDSLASKEQKEKSALNLRVNSLIMRHSSMSYEERYAPKTPGKLNLAHLKVKNVSAHILLKVLTDDSLNVDVRSLSFQEKSGLQVDKLALRFDGGKHHSHLHELQLKMPGTDLQLNDLEADYHIKEGKIDLPTLHYKGEIRSSRIRMADLGALLPSLRTFESTLLLNMRFNGQADNIAIPHLAVGSTTGDIDMDINGWVRNLRHKPQWYTNLQKISLSAKTINFISQNLQGTRIDIPMPIVRMGNIHVEGEANGLATDRIRTHQQIRTDAGNIALDFKLEDDRSFQAAIKTSDFNLRKVLEEEKFGTIATDIRLNGSLAARPVVKAKGTVSHFDYNAYSYRNIDLDAQYTANDISGHASINDPNIGLDINGNYRQDRGKKDIRLKAVLLNFAPKAINISDKWGDARFFAELEANINGNELKNAEGFMKITDFSMLSPTNNYELGQLFLNTGYRNGTHFLTMNSDFAKLEIQGNFDYSTLTKSFTNFLANQLPTLPGMPVIDRNIDNDFAISAVVQKSDWLQHLFNIPLSINSPITLDGFINDHTRTINLTCNAPAFAYNGSGYKDASIAIRTPQDSLTCRIDLIKEMDNGDLMNLNVKALAHNNNLNTIMQWSNKAEKRMSGILNTTANFYNMPNGEHAATLTVNPSHLNIHNTVWNVEPCKITYRPKHIDFNGFAIHHADQHLTIDGTASESHEDLLNVNLNEVDIEYILNLVNFHAVDFNGYASGVVQAHSLFSSHPNANAQLNVRNFEFEHGRMGTLHANVNWNDDKQQIDIQAIADDGMLDDKRTSKTFINGFVSPKRNCIDLDIEAANTHIDFMHSFTKSFISHIDGTAVGAVKLAGPLSTINIEGQLVVNAEAHIKPTGCTYFLKNDTINLVPDEITFASCPIYDVDGNSGIVTGGIHHQHLTNLSYDLYVNTDNILAYDFPDFGDDTFYGTVYGAGNVAIHGRSNETVIELNVTPKRNSTFVYNVAQPDAIGNQEFIKWESREEHRQHLESGTPSTHHASQLEDRSDMRINFLINCTPDATMRLLMDRNTNDYITLNGHGVIRASWFNKGGFQMFGTYHVDYGTYGITIQEIIKKNFTFQPGGSIVFGGDPYEAALNLQALHTVNGVSLSDLNVGKSFSNTVRVNCLMNITGKPSQPIVDFDLDMPNVNADEKQMVRSIINGQEEMNQQVLYLLGIGRFYPQGANNAQNTESQQSQTSLAMQSLLSGTLSSQINGLLKSVIKSNDWSFGANISTGDEGWNNAEYEGIVSGKMFNNRLLLNGQFGYRDKAATANTSFIGDFDVRYLLVPNGNLALNVYNQTNDRYFTKSSLNTQGLGIIIKKDFSSIPDLFGIRKDKKKLKKSAR